MAKELAVKQMAEFPALAQDIKTLQAAMAENLGGASISPFDLDKVQIPSGGGLAWTVATLEGETSVSEVMGIIVHVQNARAYWKESFGESGGGTPPDCISDDALVGIGDPGGRCAECPNAAFGSDARHRGQACKLIQRLFLLRDGDMLPVVVNLPPGSLKNARKYLLRLVSNGIKASGVVTKIGLERDKNQDGITYSKATFAMVGKLDSAQAEAACAYGKALAPAFKRVPVDDFLPAEE